MRRSSSICVPAALRSSAAKGATFYAIAISVCHIVQTLFGSANSTMTVSSMMHGEYGIEDVCLSIPFIVGRAALRAMCFPLTEEEVAKAAAQRRCA